MLEKTLACPLKVSSRVARLTWINYNLTLDVPIPPSRAMEVVNSLNTAHDDACKSFGKKEKMIDVQFEETRRKVLNIYRSWSVGPNDKASRKK
jgi:hypothetical protein